MIEPSDTERSLWPDATNCYVSALEQRVDDLHAEVQRWKGQAARNASAAIRYQIALKLARQYGMESRSFHGGVSAMLADWFDNHRQCGVPWPSSGIVQKWLTAEGYSEVDGKIGMRATLTLAGPQPTN